MLPMDALPSNRLPAGITDVTADPPLRTFRLNRENRPARLVEGPQTVRRRLATAEGSARFETSFAPLQARATMKISVAGASAPLVTVTAAAGQWTPVVAELPQSSGNELEIVEELVTAPGRLVLWGDDRLVPLAPQDNRPDVILISLDTVRPDYLTPYSPTEPTTPTLAQLAQEGMRFDQAISVTSWTMPAHAAVFSGRYPNLGLGFSERLDPGELTLAEVFSAAGYSTHGASGGPYTDSDFGFQQGFRSYLDSHNWKNAAAITDWALARLAESTRGTPLFLFLNYFDAHEPIGDLTTEEWHAIDSGKRKLTPAMRDRIRTAYRADLQTIDRQLARLFAGVRRSRNWQNTIVIAFSDHGQLLGERGGVGHALTLDEELIRVPLIVKPAGRVRPPRPIYREQFQLTDLFSLTTELAGIEDEREAASLSHVLAGRPVRDLTFAQVHHDPTPALTAMPRWQSATLRAVRTDSSKVVRDLEGRVVTYRIRSGAESEVSRGALTDRLLAELDTFERQRSGEAAASPPLVLRRELLDRLRALGYIR